ncbi:MAG: PPC domain-containing protein, partial [Gammaproteobacteria bacterium]
MPGPPPARSSLLVVLPSSTFAEMEPMLAALESSGMTPRHVFPPDTVIVEWEAGNPLPVMEIPRHSVVFEGPIDEIDRLAYPNIRPEIEMIWNANYHGQRARYGLAPKTTPTHPLVDDALEPPAYVPAGVGSPGLEGVELLTDPGNPFGAADDNTSEYLSGRVAIGLFTVESNGSGENWSAARIAEVKSEVQAAMAALVAANPLSNLTIYYDYHDQCPTTIEPITMTWLEGQDIYLPECLTSIGFPSTSSNYFAVSRGYDRSIRNAFGAHWAVSIFVVDSLNDPDGENASLFTAYSYVAGPFLVMSYDNGGWGIGRMNNVAQHEIGHSFWAFDEYVSSGCTCTQAQGYLNAQNQNCNRTPACFLDVGCIMRDADTSSTCVHSRAQMGINDTDSDGIPDVRDTIPSATLVPISTPTSDATPTFTGIATDVALANQNSRFYTTRSNITLNRITAVEYRVNGGSWISAGAVDGAFDKAQEAYTLTTGVLPPGTHTIEVRTRNSVGNFQPAPYASQTFTVTSLELAHDQCAAAQVIPPAGPFPHLTAVTPDITYATSAGDPPAPSCSGSVSRSIWYKFVPASSGSYNISSCAAAPTATTVEDTVINVLSDAGGTCSGFSAVSGGCDDNGCQILGSQAVVTTDLAAGTPYYIVVYKRGGSPPAPGETAVQLLVSRNGSGPPANDECSGAEVVPGAGPFPYLTSTTDITDAASIGDPPAPTCAGSVYRSVWYSFTPAVTGSYTISSCAEAPTATTVDDTVIDVYTAAGGACSGLAEMSGGCADRGCNQLTAQAALTADLTAGTTYYIVAWKRGTQLPQPGHGSMQLRFTYNAPLANDTCSEAEVIPGSGPFPYLTAVTADISDATSAGDPPIPPCSSSVSHSVWYMLVPDVTAMYSISSCADGPTATTVDDTVINVVTGAGGACSGYSAVNGACDDQSCGFEGAQAVVNTELIAGTTYFILVYQRGTGPLSPGNTAVQLRITRMLPPANDLCSAAEPLSLNIPAAGSTVLGLDDYRSTATTACYSGFGQQATDARGLDAIYSFTAPAPGAYSFRLRVPAMHGDPVLYLSQTCPAGPSPQTVTCLAGSHRNSQSGTQEVSCVPMLAGETVFAFVDDRNAGFAGGPFVIEVEPCITEMEPNDTPATAGPLACGLRSVMDQDRLDYFALPDAPAGWRLFAMVDGSALESTANIDLRVTTSTDTLEYDDRGNALPFGDQSPNVSGVSMPGVPAFLRFDDTRESEPYRVYSVIQPPLAGATPESEPNDSIAQANMAIGGYYVGALSGPSLSADKDVFAFTAQAGDLVLVGLDADPQRDETPINAMLELLDPQGNVIETVDDNDQASDSNVTPGSLTASRPHFPSEAIARRVPAAGTYFVRVGISPNAPLAAGAGDYLLSISKNCQPTSWTDLS